LAAEGGILLEEVKNAPIFFNLYQGKLEPAFHRNRFRLKEPIYNSTEVESYEKVKETEEVLLPV